MSDIYIIELTPYTYNEYFSLIKQLSPNAVGPAVSDELAVSKLTMDGLKKIFLAVEIATRKVIGTISLILEPKINRENVNQPKNTSFCGHIEDVVVDENYRGIGIGRKMVEYAVNYAKSCNCYKVILDCNASNVEFYKKCNIGLEPHEICMRVNL